MKKTLLVFLLATLLQPVYSQQPIDVLHYEFSITLNDLTDNIEGAAMIDFVITESTRQIQFDLQQVATTNKGMKVSSIAYMNRGNYYNRFQHINNRITITNNFIKGDTILLAIIYDGIPDDGLIIAKNKYNQRTFFADNWPDRAHHWIPCVDDPGDKASVEFVVTAPSHYQIISNGIKIEETNLSATTKLTRWSETVALPTKVMVIGAADFSVLHNGFVKDCIPVSSWVYPENKNEGFADYAVGKEILSYFIDYIGPYGYKKLANVQSKTKFGGMENASAIFYAENNITGKQQEERLMAHEIVHQWFGNMATEKSFAHLWLSEGFATYLTHIYLESKYGTDSLNIRMQEDRQQIIDFVNSTKRPVVDDTPAYLTLLNANSYQKGGWILHMLRRELGDSIFKESVRSYYAEYAGKNADSYDLQAIFETVSGKNLSTFFDQWLNRGENPSFFLTWKYNKKTKTAECSIQQKQATVFEVPLELAIKKQDGTSIPYTIQMQQREQHFTISLPEKPSRFLIDPHTSLLFEGEVKELK